MIRRNFYQGIGALAIGLSILLLIYFRRQDFFSGEKQISIVGKQEVLDGFCLAKEGVSLKEFSKNLNREEEKELKEISIIEEKRNEILDKFIEEKGNQIQMTFPQFSGLYEKEKEIRINAMIEEDAKKLLQGTSEMYEKGTLYFELNSEIKFVNKNIISIFYLGWLGGRHDSRYPSREEMATTVDMQQEKILTLSDIILDFEKLKKLLVEDKFESVTLWEGSTTLFSILYGKDADKLGFLGENRIHGEYEITGSSHTDWYTDGENFYIVIGEYRSYHEFRIKIEEIRDLLSEEFLNLLE